MQFCALGRKVRRCVVRWAIPSYRGYLYFTENLAAGTGDFSVTDGIKLWTDEAKDYNPSAPQYSHFTQVVWKATKQVGCFMATCPPGSIFDSQYGVRILLPAFIR